MGKIIVHRTFTRKMQPKNYDVKLQTSKISSNKEQ